MRKARKKHVFERLGAPQVLKIFACGAKTIDFGSFLLFKKSAAGDFFGVFWGEVFFGGV